jgi:hypothetical protein
MSVTTRRCFARRSTIAALATLPLLIVMPSVAFAADNDITNGTFQSTTGEGATPSNWAEANFGTETGPYDATIETFDVNGNYPPPSGTPGGDVAGNYATENYYEVGSATGVEGFGGSQTLTAPVASSTDPQLSWSTVETYAPPTSAASWAGSAVQVDFTSGATNYQLVFVNPFAPTSGSYSSSPSASNTATTRYVVLPALTDAVWYTQPPVDVPAAVLAQFGLSSFTITGVSFANLEDVTATYPYANMTSYWKNISLVPGTPIGALPESPVVVGLPLAGLLAGGVFLVFRRRRHALV